MIPAIAQCSRKERPRSLEAKVANSAAPRGHLGCLLVACNDHLTRGPHLASPQEVQVSTCTWRALTLQARIS